MKTPLFNIIIHRQTVRIGITAPVAQRIKARFPACIIKFHGFEGGAA
jgi:hypothetical protein